MSGLLVQIAQMVLMLSILVVLHEFGHYITAKWFNMRIEKFFLFFDWPKKIVSKKIGDTEWGIGMLPLGGYVKIAGMVDESMDKEQLKEEPKPWEFRSKPAWQRLIVMLGGVTVNILLAWLILALLYSTAGHKYDSTEKINQDGYAFGEVGKKLGFQDGDKILSVDGIKQTQYKRQVLDILLGNHVKIERNGKIQTIFIADSLKREIFEKEGKGFIVPRLKNVQIDSIANNSLAKQIGLKKGDVLISINDEKTTYFDQLQLTLRKFKNDSATIKVKRGTELLDFKTKIPDSAILGFKPKFDISKEYQKVTHYNFFQAIPVAIEESFAILVYNIKNFKLIFKPETKAYTQVKSFVGITRVLPTTWDWEFFWNFTAMFSMWLAFINLVPIPGLDGGHALFTIVEMITGRKMNDKLAGIVQTIGMVILLSLMVLLFGKDIYDIIAEKFLK